jgi:alpha-N-acetylglucosamine transferase
MYYVGARTLIYQLLHAERTKFSSPVSVVILVTTGVRESKRQRLGDDGAIVVEIEDVEHSVDIAVGRYKEVFDKLRVFDPRIMPYEKVALLDADMVITRPLDAIFEDPASQRFLVNRNATSPLAPGLPPIPDSYVLASTPDIAYRPFGFPPNLAAEEKRDYFNAGVIVLSPSTELYKLYLAVLSRTELFDGFWPEQNLLNYVHGRDGPMPWATLDLLWHLPGPTGADFEAGMAILHCKFWNPASDPCQQSAVSRRWEMQGYWSGREERSEGEWEDLKEV